MVTKEEIKGEVGKEVYVTLSNTLRSDADYIMSYDGFTGSQEWIAGNQRKAAAEIERLRDSLRHVKLRVRSARGAIQTGQIVDKEPDVTLTRALDIINEALTTE